MLFHIYLYLQRFEYTIFCRIISDFNICKRFDRTPLIKGDNFSLDTCSYYLYGF